MDVTFADVQADNKRTFSGYLEAIVCNVNHAAGPHT